MGILDQEFLQGLKGHLDVDMIGVASVETSPSKELREKATFLLAGVKSVVVVTKEAFKEVIALVGTSREVGEPERGEVLSVHSDYISGRLNRAVHELASLFRKEGYRSVPLPPAVGFITDQRYLRSLFSYKHAAELAGLGAIGRHSLLINSKFGPRLRLACILTEAPLEASPVVREDHCVNCDACIRACPAAALQVPRQGEVYSMNKFACRSYRQAGLVCSVCVKACDEILG
jgi:epoxyqueuosine reductase QueG